MPADGVSVRGLSFDPDGSCAVEFCTSADGRLHGVGMNHTMFVESGGQYDDEILAVREAVIALIRDVLVDVDSAEDRPFESFGSDDDNSEGEDD